jgi:hypothetical protein
MVEPAVHVVATIVTDVVAQVVKITAGVVLAIHQAVAHA